MLSKITVHLIKSLQNIMYTICSEYVKLWMLKTGTAKRGCLITLSKVCWKSVVILGPQGHWSMRCYGRVTESHVQEDVRDAKAGDNTVPYTDLGPAAGDHKSLMSVWREGLNRTVTLGLLSGEHIVATLTNKIWACSWKAASDCKWSNSSAYNRAQFLYNCFWHSWM